MVAGRDRDARVLVVDDEDVALRALTRIVAREGFPVVAAHSGEEALARLREGRFALVLSDVVLGDASGLDVLAAAKAAPVGPEVVLVTGHASIPAAVDAIKKGAYDYLVKPVVPDEVRAVVRQALARRGLSRAVDAGDRPCGAAPGAEELIGESEAIRRVRQTIAQLAGADVNVLITGDSGTGKEVVARAIHRSSARRGLRLLAINCASFSEELLSNELFGHEREAYTGAARVHVGLLESAHGGTVLFDEIGDMPLSMQARLLRVIQEKEIVRVGGTRPVPVDVRFLSATNKDLAQLLAAGRFREDLFYRLNVVRIHLPRLCERREDIPLLAEHFLRRCAARNDGRAAGFGEDALRQLAAYRFPGNVRELENLVQRAAALAAGERIGPGDFPHYVGEDPSFRYDRGDGLRTLEDLEDEYIRWVLERVGHNKSQAARILGIDRVSLYRRLKRL